ncbi:MAG: glycosyltransferase family 39 protein [Gammaproteobacteria bacterium]
MLAPLLNFPLLLFLLLLPVTLSAAWFLRSTGLGASVSGRPLISIALLPPIILFGCLLVFAILYLGSPTFTDHIEPNTAIVAWIYAQGGQLYHAVDAAERYAFFYGPVPYIATSWIYDLVGPGVFAAKLAGFICFLLTIAVILLSVRKRFGKQLVPYIVALGYFAIVALFFKNHSFWSKPDPFMILATAVGLYACLMRPGRFAWLLCGIALGISVNAKVTGAVYFLPYLAWFFDRDGYRAPLVILLAGAVVALLPFWPTGQVSLVNYLHWLQAAGGHGLSAVLMVQNALFLGFLLAPLIFFVIWQGGSVGLRSWFITRRLVLFGAAVSGLLILVPASRFGSGPHHSLPFLPPLAFLTAHAVSNVFAYKPVTKWSVYGFWAPLAALLIAASLKAGMAFYSGAGVALAQRNGASVAAELETIARDYPDKHIYMGYGDDSSYVATFVRAELVYMGNPYLIDPSAMMDFQQSGIQIPQATIDRMLGDEKALWLIPANQEPFTLSNRYFRHQDGLLFDENFRSAFVNHFRKSETRDYFDLYLPADSD